MQQALAGCDVLYHLISTTTPQISNDDPVGDVESNVISTINMLKEATKAGVKKIIFFSSGGTIYGVPQYTPIREEHPTEPICSYGIQKLTTEKYLHLFYVLYGLEYGILRIANPYGPRQSPYSGQGVVAAFVHRAVTGQPIEVWGDGSVVRDYVYAADVAKAAVAMLNYSGRHRIFNIGSGTGKSLLEIIHSIEALSGVSIKIDFKKFQSIRCSGKYT